ncbi:hypothetical protein EMPS_07031 [Entomortierella parvispora]|uniref:F-box domain-containing protein n=1 Tax=Entomortierella parvispora TaxID=205924 RepID=A0A9P3HE47_9FUNG|nr:hypothetical protein EMPS_07031 [Entomortierella parvispora]
MQNNESIIPPPIRSPLELNEILDAIFSFLGQQALKTIFLVCRQWHHIALRRLTPSFCWNGLQFSKGDSEYSQELETTQKNLKEARILICGQKSPRYGPVRQERNPKATARWDASLELVKEVAQAGQLQIQQLTLRLNRDSWDFGTSLFPRRDNLLVSGHGGWPGMGAHLRELTIETSVSHESFPLQRILENCPILIHLTLRATRHAVYTRLESCQLLPSETGTRVLKSLTLENLAIEATVFQEYFPQLANLKELRLIVLQADPAEGDTTLILNRTTQRSFFQLLAQHCPLLQSLVYSTAIRGSQPWLVEAVEEGNGEEDVYQMLFRMFPGVRSWGLPFDELCVTGMRRESRPLTQLSPVMVQNCVTTLEIVPGTWPFGDSDLIYKPDAYAKQLMASRLLDLFLQESPQLLHLKTKGVSFMMTSRRRLWACRGLLTLSIMYRDQYSTYKTPYVINRLRGQESRCFFAYLSRTCPALKELEMEITGEVLALRRGLCLLTRMQWLRRLTIQMSIDNWDGWNPQVHTLGENDFAWILRLPKTLPSSPPPLLPPPSSSSLSWPWRRSPSSSLPPSPHILSAEEEYRIYQSEALKSCLIKVQDDDFYNCSDRSIERATYETGPSPGKPLTAWEKIKDEAYQVIHKSAVQMDTMTGWKNGRERRAVSLRALETPNACHYWTDYGRPTDVWPMVDGLTEDFIGSLLDVEARLLALIEGQDRFQQRASEAQQTNPAEKGKSTKEGRKAREKKSLPWKKSGAVGDIMVAGPWSFMDELRIEYKPTLCWGREKVLQQHVMDVQKLLRQMRPDIDIHATYSP